MHQNVLMLNSDMMPILMPIHTIDPKTAVKRVIAGVYQETYGCYVVYSTNKRIRTPVPLDYMDLGYWPSVIAKNEYVKRPSKVSFSKRNLYARDEGKCRYCGKELLFSEMEQEHYIPRSKGGKTKWDNIVVACKECNSAKDNHDPKGKWKLEHPPHIPEYWEIVHKKTLLPISIPDRRWLDFLPEWKAEVRVLE
jgi:5-methylcytosine-specific restriction endonuclease McrA